MQSHIVRTLDSRRVVECRFCVRTRHTRALLIYGVRIGSHQAHPLGGLCIQRHVGTPTITLRRILQHEGLLVRTIVIGIDRTVVHTIEACETTYVRCCPVRDEDSIHGLVENKLTSHREGE